MAPWRLGLVGLGTISRYYLAGIERLPTFRLAAVCDVDVGRLAPFRHELPCYGTHQEMIRDAALDAVIVAVPNDLHASVCSDALCAGLPVCVEKPLATDLTAGRGLVAQARHRGLPLLTAFHRRHNGAVVRLRRDLAGKPPIRSLRVRYLERIEEHAGDNHWYLDPARCGGGCVADNGPNAFDLTRLLLGEVKVIDACIERDARGIDRRAVVNLRAESGSTAHVQLDWSYDGECKELEVERVDGTIHLADMLHGHSGFKGSLWHEYIGVLDQLDRVLTRGRPEDDGGLPALKLVTSTYGAAKSDRVPSPDRSS